MNIFKILSVKWKLQLSYIFTFIKQSLEMLLTNKYCVCNFSIISTLLHGAGPVFVDFIMIEQSGLQ